MVSEHFKKETYSKVFAPVVSCRLKSCNFIQRKLHYIRFAVYFPTFLVQLFQKRPQNTLAKTSVMEYS